LPKPKGEKGALGQLRCGVTETPAGILKNPDQAAGVKPHKFRRRSAKQGHQGGENRPRHAKKKSARKNQGKKEEKKGGPRLEQK